MTRIQPVRTSDGRRLEVSHVIAAPADDAWTLLVDTTRWADWSPVISGVVATDRRVESGTAGQIRLPGVWLPFRVTDRADRRWTWTLAGLPGAGHRVDDLGEKRCRVVFELPPHAMGYVPVCLVALEELASLLEDDRDH